MRFQLFSLALAGLVAANAKYDGAKALRITTGSDVTQISSVVQKLGLAIWKGAVAGVPQPNTMVDLVVPAAQLKEFNAMTLGLKTQVLHEDLGASIAEEAPVVNEFQASAAGKIDISWFNSYHPYADHIQWLSDFQALYPNNSEIVVAGNSGQGRPITGLHFYGNAGKGKPAVILHGTVHAREWVTTMTTEYFIFSLLGNYTTDNTIAAFVDKYDYYIFPVVNPDGFVYSQTTDRLWRKNRQAPSGSATCIGRDINRNWPSHWDVRGGASTNACDEDYKGAAAGDATENKVLTTFSSKIASTQGIQLFIDLHSYSQLFMYPYGYSCSATVAGTSTYQSLTKGAVAAITKVYGTKYQYGPICSTIYQATGTSVDYVQDVSKGKYVFTIELRDTGAYGFVLPASQILPTGKETWEGLKYLLAGMA